MATQRLVTWSICIVVAHITLVYDICDRTLFIRLAESNCTNNTTPRQTEVSDCAESYDRLHRHISIVSTVLNYRALCHTHQTTINDVSPSINFCLVISGVINHNLTLCRAVRKQTTIIQVASEQTTVREGCPLLVYILEVQTSNLCICRTKQWRLQALNSIAVTIDCAGIALDWSPLLLRHIDVINEYNILCRCCSHVCKVLQVGSIANDVYARVYRREFNTIIE